MYCINCIPIRIGNIFETKIKPLTEGICEACSESNILAIHDVEQYYCEECNTIEDILVSIENEINIVQYKKIKLLCGHFVYIDYENS